MFSRCTKNLQGLVRQHRRYLASSSVVYKSYALDGKGWDVLSGKTTRIGCASGFWGDSPSAGLISISKLVQLINVKLLTSLNTTKGANTPL